MLKSNKIKKVRNDIILVAIILSLSLIGFLIFKLTMKDGNHISVSINGKEKYSYSLSDSIETDIITGENGENTNTLVIKDCKAYIKSATCPDKICVGHRPISKDGETIVCLPHKIVISVTEEK
ncbi:MAG: NusG domain II-containing protein [Clostridia bacterium]|nr:NusG domain II-containing protein [Clostridia bacterium]